MPTPTETTHGLAEQVRAAEALMRAVLERGAADDRGAKRAQQCRRDLLQSARPAVATTRTEMAAACTWAPAAAAVAPQPPPAQRSLAVGHALGGGLCAVGHQLFAMSPSDSTARCDQCAVCVSPGTVAFSCNWCGYDLCPECHALLWPSSAASASGPVAAAVPMSLPVAMPSGDPAVAGPTPTGFNAGNSSGHMPVAVATTSPAAPLAVARPVALESLSAAEQAAAPIAVAVSTSTAVFESSVGQNVGGIRLAPSVALSALERRIRRAKLKARPMLFLHQWYRWQHHKLPLDLGLPPPGNNIEVIDGLTVSPVDFRKRYELLYRPVLIDGLLTGQRCERHWTPEAIGATLGEWNALVGRGAAKEQVRLKIEDFLQYCQAEHHGKRDDSPLYVFDPEFGEDSLARRLLGDYAVPKYFTEDLFRYAGKDRRPPHRWFLMGPPRSGSAIHTDPLNTSAWNMLAHGKKWWVLFEPTIPKEVVQPEDLPEDLNPFAWFGMVLPRLVQQGVPRIELIQEPGETIFVPGGWWHAVLNLTDTVAVTQNFCSSANFPAVWSDVSEKRPGLAAHWISALDQESLQQQQLQGLVSLAVRHTRMLAETAAQQRPRTSSDTDGTTEKECELAKSFLDALGETGAESDCAGGLLGKRAATALGLFLQHRKERRVEAKEDARVRRETALQRLVDGGADEERAHVALRSCKWDAEAAFQMLRGGDVDSP